MGCFSSKPAPPDPLPATREVTSQRPPVPVSRQDVRASEPSPQPSRANVGQGPPQVEEPLPRRSKTTPVRPSASVMKGGGDLPPAPAPIFRKFRTKSSVTPSHKRPSTPTSAAAELPRPPPRQLTLSNPSRRPLESTVQQILPEHFKFRILVVGKRGSGKSSLIKSVFKVDGTAAPERAPGKADIDVAFCPEDNRYLNVHEYSGLDSGDLQDLQSIRAFISRRTDPSCSPAERLHAIWMCVPTSDAIEGRLGDGVKELLALRNVPVILVLTKFDALVSKVGLDIPSGEPQHHERARARAYAMYQDFCRQIFRKEPKDVPAEVVSEKARFIDLIDNLVMTTDGSITGSRASSSRAGAQGTNQRLGTVPLAWSAAVRVNHDIIIQASIEVGRSRYWRSLWSSLDFADQRLKNCVRIIHDDIVEIWNLNDKTRYLLSDKFKARMSHLVKDLAISANATSRAAAGAYADWVDGVYKYRKSPKNVRCVMGYIVDLTVILDAIFRVAAGDMSPNHAEQVLERHVRSGKRDAIHLDIRSFIEEVPTIEPLAPHKDLILEKIIDLIKQFCVPPQ